MFGEHKIIGSGNIFTVRVTLQVALHFRNKNYYFYLLDFYLYTRSPEYFNIPW